MLEVASLLFEILVAVRIHVFVEEISKAQGIT